MENRLTIRFVAVAFVLYLIGILVAGGCVTLQSKQGDICQTLPAGEYSVLCEISDKTGVSLGGLGKVLTITNKMALRSDEYTKYKVLKFVQDAKRSLVAYRDITYSDVIKYLKEEYRKIPVEVQLVFDIIDPLQEVLNADIQIAKALSDFDINEVLLPFLDKQEDIIKGIGGMYV